MNIFSFGELNISYINLKYYQSEIDEDNGQMLHFVGTSWDMGEEISNIIHILAQKD
jgi:hypothetical protein